MAILADNVIAKKHVRFVRCLPLSIWERSGPRDTRVNGCYNQTETLPPSHAYTSISLAHLRYGLWEVRKNLVAYLGEIRGETSLTAATV
jgi:hypothetical protein